MKRLTTIIYIMIKFKCNYRIAVATYNFYKDFNRML